MCTALECGAASHRVWLSLRVSSAQWISADADIATARGGGGGLALWRRDAEMEAKMREEAA